MFDYNKQWLFTLESFVKKVYLEGFIVPGRHSAAKDGDHHRAETACRAACCADNMQITLL